MNEATARAVRVVSDAPGCVADLVTPDVSLGYPVGDIDTLPTAIAEAFQLADLSGLQSAAEQRSAQHAIVAKARCIEAVTAGMVSR